MLDDRTDDEILGYDENGLPLLMVVDSSALVAILRGEPEGPAFRNAIRTARNRLLGAPTRVEAGMVALGRRGEPGLEQMQALIERLELDVVPLAE